MTSSARTIRRPLLVRMAAAAAGSSGRQPGVQHGRALGRQFVLQPGPDGRIGAGELHLVDRRPDVQPRAADQHRRAPGREQSVDLGPGQPLVLGDAGGLGHVPDVQQVVRDAAALGGVSFAVPMSMPR